MDVQITDFLRDGENCAPAFAEAVASLAEGDTLRLGGGTYHFYPDGAFEKEYYISNNDSGRKSVALPFLNKRGVTLDGEGAELIFHGNMVPVLSDGCENLTLKNFSVDYASPFYAQAEILSADETGILLGFDGKEFSCRVRDGKCCFFGKSDGWELCPERMLSLEFDRGGHPSATSRVYYAYMGPPRDHGFQSGLYLDVRPEERGENRIFLRGNFGNRHRAGNYWVAVYAGRKSPGVLITDSKDVRVESVRLYHTAGMGVLAQKSENITLDRVVAAPREGSGRLLSTSADATHFVHCRGKVSLVGCRFEGMMDDAANIHGIYNLYRKQDSDGSLLLGFGHPQQKGIQAYRKGDLVAVIDSGTNERKAVGRVLDACLESPEEIRLKLDCPVPSPGEYWVTENLSTAPDVHFCGCSAGYNRPRGFLISSAGKVLVEKCRFCNMSSGVQLSGEMKDWYESGRVTDVCIRDCDFDNSAYAGGVAIACRPSLRCTDTVFNGKIVIENNRFVQGHPRICAVESCEEVVFRNNRFRADPTLSDYPTFGEEGVGFRNCGKILFEKILPADGAF